MDGYGDLFTDIPDTVPVVETPVDIFMDSSGLDYTEPADVIPETILPDTVAIPSESIPGDFSRDAVLPETDVLQAADAPENLDAAAQEQLTPTPAPDLEGILLEIRSNQEVQTDYLALLLEQSQETNRHLSSIENCSFAVSAGLGLMIGVLLSLILSSYLRH